MVPISDPSDNIPIFESINGLWKLIIWKDTTPFMQARKAGFLADKIFVQAKLRFFCDATNFKESQILPDGRSYHYSHLIGEQKSDGKRKWWTSERKNVLETNQIISVGKKDRIYVHENRCIKKGRLHIVSHYNVKMNGEKQKNECLRIFERVPEELPEVEVTQESKDVNEKCKVPVEEIPKMAEKTEEPKEATQKEIPVQKVPEDEIPKEVVPSQPLQEELSGDWKLSKVFGWAAFHDAIQLDKDLIWATANFSISPFFNNLYTIYTTNGMDPHQTMERINEPMEMANGFSKTIQIVKNYYLLSITKDNKTGEEISRMVRFQKDGRLYSEYHCMGLQFAVVHQKLY